MANTDKVSTVANATDKGVTVSPALRAFESAHATLVKLREKKIAPVKVEMSEDEKAAILETIAEGQKKPFYIQAVRWFEERGLSINVPLPSDTTIGARHFAEIGAKLPGMRILFDACKVTGTDIFAAIPADKRDEFTPENQIDAETILRKCENLDWRSAVKITKAEKAAATAKAE